MTYYEDETSFGAPLRAALEDVEKELRGAGRKVAGAFDRAEAALRAKSDLRAFVNRLAKHIEADDFAELPRLRSRLVPIDGCHHLTTGEWRGVFLVDGGTKIAVGIVFSRSPHDLRGRLDEAIARNRSHLEPSDEEEE